MLAIRATIVARNPPIVTWGLILVNSVVFLFELTMPEPALEQFFYLFGLVPARYTHPTWALWVGLPMNDYWPFLTSMFLQGGWMPIIGTMWTGAFGHSDASRSRCWYRRNTLSRVPLYLAHRSANI